MVAQRIALHAFATRMDAEVSVATLFGMEIGHKCGVPR